MASDPDANLLMSSCKEIETSILRMAASFSTFFAYTGTLWPYSFVFKFARNGCTSAMVGREIGDLSMHLAARLRRSSMTSSDSVIAECRKIVVFLEVFASARSGRNCMEENKGYCRSASLHGMACLERIASIPFGALRDSCILVERNQYIRSLTSAFIMSIQQLQGTAMFSKNNMLEHESKLSEDDVKELTAITSPQ